MSEISPLHIIEAALFAANAPLSLEKLVKLFPEEQKVKINQVKKWIDELQASYEERGIHLVEVASGYRFQVANEIVPILSNTSEEKPARFSRALLETLALIAYRQPITRGEIEEIRGVVVSTHIMKTLDELGWVRIVGYKDVPGKPGLYATSKTFLDYFGLKTLEDLPPLVELKELDVIESMVDNQELQPVQAEIDEEIEVHDEVVDLPSEAVLEEVVEPETELEESDAPV